MSERTTGATDEQIEAGAKAYFVHYENTDPDAYREWPAVGHRESELYREIAETILRASVPADHAIVGPDELAAIAYVVSFLDGYKAPEQIGCAVWDVAPVLKTLAERTDKP